MLLREVGSLVSFPAATVRRSDDPRFASIIWHPVLPIAASYSHAFGHELEIIMPTMGTALRLVGTPLGITVLLLLT